jgi:ABC-type transport system involved in cytochrome c biogenesis permease component
MRDGWTIARRDLLHWARQPGQVLIALLFPVLIVVMFGYLLGGSMRVAGGGDYREFLLPGMYALTMVFGLEATVTAVTTDASRGITDRFRSMPMASSAVVVGRSVADMLHSTAGLAIMLLCGLAVGWRWHEGPARALAAVGLLLLLRFAMLWLGIWLALLVPRPEGGTGDPHPGLADRVPVQRVRLPAGHAGLAGGGRRLEPAVVHGRRGTAPVRQPRRGRRLVDHRASRADGARLAGRVGRGVLPALGAPLPEVDRVTAQNAAARGPTSRAVRADRMGRGEF